TPTILHHQLDCNPLSSKRHPSLIRFPVSAHEAAPVRHSSRPSHGPLAQFIHWNLSHAGSAWLPEATIHVLPVLDLTALGIPPPTSRHLPRRDAPSSMADG
ncbi:hypothetical protein RB213_012105, partial [Colletotrichum asianum]